MSTGQTLEGYVARADELMQDQFSWYVVAKKEYQDAIRSKGLWVLAFVFTTLFVIPPAGVLYFDVQLGRGLREFGMELLISTVYTNAATFLVPVIAMFVGFGAITKERESGSLKILLSLPHSRKDVVVGKVLGRCTVVGVPLIIAYLITAVFLLLTRVTFKAELFALFALYTIGLALVFVAIAVSISGAMPRSLYSIVGNFIVYVYFTFSWNAIANALADGLKDYLGISGALRWNITLFIKLLNPSQAYKTLTNSMLGDGANAARSARYRMFSQDAEQMRTICGDVLRGSPSVQETLFGERVVCEAGSQSLPFYFTDAAVFVYLLVWIGVAAVVSYRTFNLADL